MSISFGFFFGELCEVQFSPVHHYVRVKLDSVWGSVLGLILFVCDFARFMSVCMRRFSLVCVLLRYLVRVPLDSQVEKGSKLIV